MARPFSRLARSTASIVRRFRADKDGVAAVEFAFVLPIMITLYIGSVATTIGVMTDRKLTILTHSIADIVAQSTTVKADDPPKIFAAAKAIMSPYDTTDTVVGMRIQSVSIKSATNACLEWSISSSTLLPTRTDTNVITLIPLDLRTVGTHLVWSETVYKYTPIVGSEYTGGVISLTGQNFLRPRQSGQVDYAADTTPAPC